MPLRLLFVGCGLSTATPLIPLTPRGAGSGADKKQVGQGHAVLSAAALLADGRCLRVVDHNFHRSFPGRKATASDCSHLCSDKSSDKHRWCTGFEFRDTEKGTCELYDECTEAVAKERNVPFGVSAPASHTWSGDKGLHGTKWSATAEENCKRQYKHAVRHFRDEDTDKHANMRGDEFRNNKTAPNLLLVHVGHTCGGSVTRFLASNSEALGASRLFRGRHGKSGSKAQNHPAWAQVHIHPVRDWVVDGSNAVSIVLRDPVDRLISAYNTEACLSDPEVEFAVCRRQPSDFVAAIAFRGGRGRTDLNAVAADAADNLQTCFPNVGAFADGIDDDTECGRLARDAVTNSKYGHVAMGACYYLGGVLDRLKHKSVHLIQTETCDADMQAVPKWLGLSSSFERTEEKHTGSFPHHDDTVSPEGRKRLEKHLTHEYALLGELKKLERT